MLTLEQKIAKTLTRDGKTLSLAESCTGGLIANRLTDIPGSSLFFTLGIVAYANATKTKLLKVPPFLLAKYGAVSSQVAKKMASGARQISKTDFGVSVTGIAGPTGGTKNKPVGLVYIAVSSKKATQSFRFVFKGTRTVIKKKAASQALCLLFKAIA
ncbi:MAG TPA: nicotinamide-nucleotide amidohydrolase family protein [Candidatus Omnitrophota bacterium]|nr:nicotinamide-nucleotide amidohydrolase family protein [Candidatus Omnitrophota bacterium]HPD85075.1 nicotinamide-nucleotide amidohydrolase family protein [Candidatus Omnitrophota bacterium]HRZ03933.1 nicotinamide-nucleotide amidohydrolase family protein [Candidatus Omnitrophota bacterium]